MCQLQWEENNLKMNSDAIRVANIPVVMGGVEYHSRQGKQSNVSIKNPFSRILHYFGESLFIPPDHVKHMRHRL